MSSSRSLHSQVSSQHQYDLCPTNQSVYIFCLRIAILIHICTPKPASAIVTAPSSQQDKKPASSDSWSTAFYSIGDVFGKSAASTSVKLPKEMPKLLSVRIESIVKGQDRVSAYNEADFRAVMGAYYGAYNAPSFQRQFKENRKVEELILTFVTSAQAVLKKRAIGEEWKEALMAQTTLFVRLVRDILDSKEIPSRHLSKELLDRLDSYLARLSPASQALPNSTSSKESPAITTSGESIQQTELVRQVGYIFSIPADQLAKDVMAQKKIATEKSALRDLKTCISNVNSSNRFPGRREDFDSDDAFQAWRKTELDTVQQLILAMATVNRDAISTETENIARPLLGRPASMAFPSSSSSLNFLSSSTSSNQIATPLSPPASSSTGWSHVRSPSLTFRPTPSANPLSQFDYFTPPASTNESVDETEEEILSPFPSTPASSFRPTAEFPAAGYDFTFIPPNPRSYYSFLLNACLEQDLAALKDLPADQEVSLKILSKPNQALLAECGLRWRLSVVTRSTLFVEEIIKKFVADEIPVIECVDEALLELDSIVSNSTLEEPWDSMMLIDRQRLSAVLLLMFDLILNRFGELLQQPSTNSLQEIEGLKRTLNLVSYHPVFREDIVHLNRSDYLPKIERLAQSIQDVAVKSYQHIRLDVLYKEKDGHGYIKAVREVAKWFRGMVMVVDKLFPEPILQSIDVVAIFFRGTSPMLVEDIETAKEIVPALLDETAMPSPEIVAAREEDLQQLFEAAREHADMYQAFCDGEILNIDFTMFEPLVIKWLHATSQKTLGWVNAAVVVDKFQPEGEDHHSSSIVDLIESCNSAVDHLLGMKWPDEVVAALFMTRLSQSVAKAIEEYCEQLERLFMSAMFPPNPNAKTNADPETDERTSAWLVRAKGLVQNEKKVEPFSFNETTLVKLNNIQAARDLLDKMYNHINVDRVSELAAQLLPPAPSATDPSARNLFTIKVVLGEDLVGSDDTQKLNPFLTLSDSSGHRIAKTRTLYNTNNPRWGEVFDVSIQGSLWLASTCYHRNLVEDHDLISRGYIHLNPAKYNDFLQRELWVAQSAAQQDNQGAARKRGRCLFRISMEGEQDDIQFYFGRCFRSLKRTEGDMVRIIVDKMSPMIRTSMSRSVLKSLLKKGGFLANLPTNINMDVVTRQFNEKIKLDKVKALFSQYQGGEQLEIPPLPSEVLSTPANLTSPERKKRPGLNDAEIEDAIGTLFEYFEDTFALLKETLNESAFRIVMAKIWKEILTVIEGLLVPALSDLPSDMRPLNDKEVYIVMRWLKGLSNFFYANGEGVPIEDLHNTRFRQLLALPLFYELSTDELMMECNRALNSLLAASTQPAPLQQGIRRNKSVYQQRNLGTIRQRKTLKRSTSKNGAQDLTEASPEMMMRILRMRPNSQEFLVQQLETLHKIQQQDAAKPQPLLPAKQRSLLSRRTFTKNAKGRNDLPFKPLP